VPQRGSATEYSAGPNTEKTEIEVMQATGKSVVSRVDYYRALVWRRACGLGTRPHPTFTYVQFSESLPPSSIDRLTRAAAHGLVWFTHLKEGNDVTWRPQRVVRSCFLCVLNYNFQARDGRHRRPGKNVRSSSSASAHVYTHPHPTHLLQRSVNPK
jgi:hypothetical protein